MRKGSIAKIQMRIYVVAWGEGASDYSLLEVFELYSDAREFALRQIEHNDQFYELPRAMSEHAMWCGSDEDGNEISLWITPHNLQKSAQSSYHWRDPLFSPRQEVKSINVLMRGLDAAGIRLPNAVLRQVYDYLCH